MFTGIMTLQQNCGDMVNSGTQASNVFSVVFVGTTPFAASMTFFSETGVANGLAFDADSSLVRSIFFFDE